jgi:hypothetical protein
LRDADAFSRVASACAGPFAGIRAKGVSGVFAVDNNLRVEK